MKKIALILFCLLQTYIMFAQEKSLRKPFFQGSIATTFALNEDYIFEDYDVEPFLIPASVMFRIGVGYQFNNKFSLSGHAGYDYHFNYFINAIPTYVTAQYALYEKYGDKLYVSYSQGKMWRPSPKFEDGNYYAFGVGWEFVDAKRWNSGFEFTYHRKLISDFENGRLDSFSLGIFFKFF